LKRAKEVWILCLMILVTGVASCAPQSLIAPPAPPTLAPGSVETIAASTAAIAQAQTITAIPPSNTPAIPTDTAAPSRTPTQTPTATATVLFLFPTETLDTSLLFVATTSGDESAGATTVSTPTKEVDEDKYNYFTGKEWACLVLSKSPPVGTAFSPKSRFKVTWVVKNMGSKTWPKKGVDVVFKGGARIHDRAYYDIPATVYPGNTVSIGLTFTAPQKKDSFNLYWTLKVGQREFCTLPFSFETR